MRRVSGCSCCWNDGSSRGSEGRGSGVGRSHVQLAMESDNGSSLLSIDGSGKKNHLR